MRSPRIVLIAAGLLVVVGLVVIYTGSGDTNFVNISSDDPHLSMGDESLYAVDSTWTWAAQTNIGAALVWLGTLLMAGTVGHRIASRRSPSA